MEIIVEGKAKDFVKPDKVNLDFTFRIMSQSYMEAIFKGGKVVEKFIDEVLVKNGFKSSDMKTRSFVVREEQQYNEILKKYEFKGYSFNQSTHIEFDYDKDKIDRLIQDISRLEDAPVYHISFGIKDLNGCKRKIISKSYKDAKAQAQAIASAAGLTLKNCAKVDFKPFSNSYVSDSIYETRGVGSLLKSESFEKNNSIAFTPEDIEVNEVLYCLWIAE